MSDRVPATLVAADAPSGFSGAEYNYVATNTQLLGVQLLNLAMSSNAADFSRANLKLKADRKLLSCRYSEDDSVGAAIFRYEVAAKSGRVKAFSCTAEYGVLYQLPSDAAREAAMAFCRKIGMFAAYPYFRAVAAQMAWNAGIDLPPMPTIAAMPVVPKETKPADGEPSA
jgi:hypothetical protein